MSECRTWAHYCNTGADRQDLVPEVACRSCYCEPSPAALFQHISADVPSLDLTEAEFEAPCSLMAVVVHRCACCAPTSLLGRSLWRNRFANRRPLQRLLFQDTQGYGIRDKDAVQRAAPGDVLYLKGHTFPGNTGTCLSAVTGNMPATHTGLHRMFTSNQSLS